MARWRFGLAPGGTRFSSGGRVGVEMMELGELSKSLEPVNLASVFK